MKCIFQAVFETKPAGWYLYKAIDQETDELTLVVVMEGVAGVVILKMSIYYSSIQAGRESDISSQT